MPTLRLVVFSISSFMVVGFFVLLQEDNKHKGNISNFKNFFIVYFFPNVTFIFAKSALFMSFINSFQVFSSPAYLIFLIIDCLNTLESIYFTFSGDLKFQDYGGNKKNVNKEKYHLL